MGREEGTWKVKGRIRNECFKPPKGREQPWLDHLNGKRRAERKKKKVRLIGERRVAERGDLSFFPSKRKG